MALNIKILFPRPHPEVTYPVKGLTTTDMSSREDLNLEHDKQQEQAFKDEAKRMVESAEKLKLKLNIIR
ncbi:MAG: hypothetical protein COW00_10355 [Bdellovibrio sp. CG12_big_fil_rev_8_21_14_0_65_39_13]|nr:MAG: hypothetical protein COW78_00960 [Bdellovibrio sp. CG22_combo_CG10-13_8_21_14_all_39_27]PIQ59513.1 MAG: hypothetical protein COW00_10355 [Bdellovibrio sp. CG12_big_fil_rev_8_21_14_0_65_39_13]PIR33483.1 MAG: hypothetical protein COV37_16130 [Bdellovibrio sp. CG11_big_fil_rev_8_21_14_0_20_39_38]